MKMIRLIAVFALTATAAAAAAAPSQAMTRGHFGFGRGPLGNGYFHSRQVNRQPGSVAVNRNTQGWNGHGVRSTRDASWGNGSYNGSASHTFNDGRSMGRDTSLHRNADGSVSYDLSRTRLDGSTVDRSGTIDRPLH
jgi:hypothetical protein